MRVEPPSGTQLALEQFVYCLWIGFTARCFHGLTDEPADGFRVRLRIRDLVGIGCNDLVDDLLDCGEVGDLLHPARFNDRGWLAALTPNDLEQILGDLAGNGA